MVNWFLTRIYQDNSMKQEYSFQQILLRHLGFHMKKNELVALPQFSSVQSLSLWPLGLQHTRLPCLPPTPRAYLNSYPSSQWCHPTISSSVVPFSSCLQSYPASESFQMSQFFASGGQSIGVLALALPQNIQKSKL